MKEGRRLSELVPLRVCGMQEEVRVGGGRDGILGHSRELAPLRWLCLENSPCHDVVPNRWFAPEFYFKVLVSNR